MVHGRVLEVDLAEASHFVRQRPGVQERETSVSFDFFFECKFRPWHQADWQCAAAGSFSGVSWWLQSPHTRLRWKSSTRPGRGSERLVNGVAVSFCDPWGGFAVRSARRFVFRRDWEVS